MWRTLRAATPPVIAGVDAGQQFFAPVLDPTLEVGVRAQVVAALTYLGGSA